MQVVDVELQNRVIEDDEMKLEPRRMVTPVAIPVDFAVQEDDAIAGFANLVKNGQFPTVIAANCPADCFHGSNLAGKHRDLFDKSCDDGRDLLLGQS